MNGTPTTTNQTKKFSSYHPIIPKQYTPGWIQDMGNRELIIQNAKMSGLHQYEGVESSLFLDNRERLCLGDTQQMANSTASSGKKGHLQHQQQPRDRRGTNTTLAANNKRTVPLHSSLSKYQSSIMFRHQDNK